MQKPFRVWLNTCFLSWARTSKLPFSQSKAIGGSGFVRGETVVARQGINYYFVILRYHENRQKIELCLAWNKRKSAPAEDVYQETYAVLKNEGLASTIRLERGWLNASEIDPALPNWFEPQNELLDDPSLLAVAAHSQLRSFWTTMGAAQEITQTPELLRRSLLTWDNVAGIAPELVTENVCSAYYGRAVDDIENAFHRVEDFLLSVISH